MITQYERVAGGSTDYISYKDKNDFLHSKCVRVAMHACI